MLSQPARKPRNWSYNNYLRLNDDTRSEIIGGMVTIAPTPSLKHQDIFRDLGFLLWQHVREHQLGVIYQAPVDVIFDDHNVVQPDLVFISHQRSEILHEWGIMGAPDLIAEIVSQSSAERDRNAKKRLYEQFGVREYWIINPADRSIEIWGLEDGRYYLLRSVAGGGTLCSEVLAGFCVDLNMVIP